MRNALGVDGGGGTWCRLGRLSIEANVSSSAVCADGKSSSQATSALHWRHWAFLCPGVKQSIHIHAVISRCNHKELPASLQSRVTIQQQRNIRALLVSKILSPGINLMSITSSSNLEMFLIGKLLLLTNGNSSIRNSLYFNAVSKTTVRREPSGCK